MALSDVLANIPGYAGWEAVKQKNRGIEEQQAQNAVRTMGVLQQIAAQQEKAQQRARIEQVATSLPEAERPAFMVDPAGYIKSKREGYTLAPGARRVVDGKVVAEAPPLPQRPMADNRPEILRLQEALGKLPEDSPMRGQIQDRITHLTTRPDRVESKPEIVKLQEAMDKLPEGHPMRKSIEARIGILTSRQPPTNVYPTNLVPGVDKDGNPVFVQPSGRPDTPPRVVEGVTPPERPDDKKAREAARTTEATVGSVRQRITDMTNIIQQNEGVVGPLGMVRRGAETVAGAVSPNMPTPAIDLNNQMTLLLADVRKLVEKDPNLSNQERNRLYESLGSGIMNTPGSAIRAMNNVLQYVEGKAATGPSPRRRATDNIEEAPREAGQRTAGKVYQTPRGPMKWTGTGWLPAN